jgi:hypothetical protein
MAKTEGTEAAADGAAALDDRLAHCRGFQVESIDGRVGFVVAKLHATDDRPGGLVVRVGLFRKQVVLVSAEAVTAVRRERRRVVVATAVGRAGSPVDTNDLERLLQTQTGGAETDGIDG